MSIGKGIGDTLAKAFIVGAIICIGIGLGIGYLFF